jgi:hypothetical protein
MKGSGKDSILIAEILGRRGNLVSMQDWSSSSKPRTASGVTLSQSCPN